LVAGCSGDRSALCDRLTARRRCDPIARTLSVVLTTIGDDFDSFDDIGLKHLSTDDGTKTCLSTYESAND
jgi:hypothetical protein